MPNRSSSLFPSAPCALFLVGTAGTGKSTLARQWVRHCLAKGEPWALVDRDQVTALHTPRMMQLLGGDPGDRDSPLYKKELRDIDYGAALLVAAEQLSLGLSVVLPGPWTKELNGGALFVPQALGLPPETRIAAAQLNLPPDERRRLIEKRGNPADRWKLDNWEAYLNANPDREPHPKVPVLHAQEPMPVQLALLERIVSKAGLSDHTH